MITEIMAKDWKVGQKSAADLMIEIMVED